MKCQNCNNIILEKYKYCPKCGARVTKVKDMIQSEYLGKERIDVGLSSPISWIGIIGIIVFVLLLFIEARYDEKRMFLVLSCLAGVAYPIRVILRRKLDKDEKTSGLIAVMVGFVISVIISLFVKENRNNDFFVDFMEATTSRGVLILYFFVLLLSSFFSVILRRLGIITLAFFLGLVTPLIVSGLVMMCFFIIAIIIIFLLKGVSFNTGGSVRESNPPSNGGSTQTDESNTFHSYEIIWENEKGYIKSTTKTYSTFVNDEIVVRDFRSIFWNNGERIRIISVTKIR